MAVLLAYIERTDDVIKRSLNGNLDNALLEQ